MAPTSTRARVLRAAAALAAGTALFAGGSTGAALANVPAGTTQTAFDRSLHLEGAKNARDVGGYRTVDGKVVKTGLVFRTDALNNLTPADLTKLQGLNVKVDDDLRTAYERTFQPDRVPAGAKVNWNDVLGGSPITTALDLPAAYIAFVNGPGASEAISAVLRDIRDSDGSVLYHCTSGKDRTGWTTAVLLTILGVDRATVNQDYMLSNTFRGVKDNESGSATINGVKQEWLDSSFATAEQKYGSFDNYVHQGLGLSDNDIAALKARLLA